MDDYAIDSEFLEIVSAPTTVLRLEELAIRTVLWHHINFRDKIPPSLCEMIEEGVKDWDLERCSNGTEKGSEDDSMAESKDSEDESENDEGDDEDEREIDDEDERDVDDEDERVIEDERDVDDEDERDVDDEDERVVDDEDERVVDDEDERVIDNEDERDEMRAMMMMILKRRGVWF
nr:nucleolin-like [Lytechinus pictus]